MTIRNKHINKVDLDKQTEREKTVTQAILSIEKFKSNFSWLLTKGLLIGAAILVFMLVIMSLVTNIQFWLKLTLFGTNILMCLGGYYFRKKFYTQTVPQWGYEYIVDGTDLRHNFKKLLTFFIMPILWLGECIGSYSAISIIVAFLSNESLRIYCTNGQAKLVLIGTIIYSLFASIYRWTCNDSVLTKEHNWALWFRTAGRAQWAYKDPSLNKIRWIPRTIVWALLTLPPKQSID